MNYEKLGAFYLGRRFDPEKAEPNQDLILYDSKDLTTHAVCVGMTGSGKTGLCVSLLEEAAIDGIPVIAIDPKGDLGNLMLTFPELDSASFAPWIDEGEALRKGSSKQAYAKKTADLWRRGLASWDQDGERIARLKAAADFNIYTPGSTAGLQLTVLKSFAAPPQEVMDDEDLFRERVQSATSGLMALVGIDPDPLRSREHILVANLLDRAWKEGRDLKIEDLIREIADPPFGRLGVFDLDSFYPEKDRFALAMSLNNLLASPGFSSWMQGDPLNIDQLLWTAEGKPRVSILNIAHLSEAQRMFFVTSLLNEVVAWMRTQPGTTSLRALLYMDEVFGFLPPVANPPSKTPMITLLKQARAFGLGCVLATQNPVDLDYKALSNAGTWFLGRLQTERDKMRVLDGLEGASAASGQVFDRKAVEATLSGLQSRVFLMNNVHEDAPVLFHSRWALSYLRGPLTRAQIQKVMKEKKAAHTSRGDSPLKRALPQGGRSTAAKKGQSRPTLPSGIEERFIPAQSLADKGETLVYRPALFGAAKLHFISAPYDLDQWEDAYLLTPLEEDTPDPWAEAEPFSDDPGAFEKRGEDDARFGELPTSATKTKSYTTWKRLLKEHLYRSREIGICKCSKLKMISKPGMEPGQFRVELAQVARERRDLEVEKLRRRYAPKILRMEERIQRAQQKVEREKSQYTQKKMDTAISFGATLLGAIFGRKKTSIGNVGRAATTARGLGRAAKERGDIARAEESLASLRPRLRELEEEFEESVAEIQDQWDVDQLEVKERRFRPRKSDLSVSDVRLVWAPWKIDAQGIAEPLFE